MRRNVVFSALWLAIVLVGIFISVQLSLGKADSNVQSAKVVVVKHNKRVLKAQIKPKPWPAGKIYYYNGTISYTWAIKRAVAMWNNSGLPIHLQATHSLRDADVIIIDLPKRVIWKRYCHMHCNGLTSHTGYVPGLQTVIYLNQALPLVLKQKVIIHETGHTLGLEHSPTKCSLMYHTVGCITVYRGIRQPFCYLDKLSQRRLKKLYGVLAIAQCPLISFYRN